jgi:hypothetical protein
MSGGAGERQLAAHGVADENERLEAKARNPLQKRLGNRIDAEDP